MKDKFRSSYSLQMNCLHFRCPARVRTYTKSNKIDIINIEHNHPLQLPRKQTGKGRKNRKSV